MGDYENRSRGFRTPPGPPTNVKAEKTTMDETEKEKLRSGLSSGKAAKGGGEDMPKPMAGEDMMTPAYRERVRQWREAKRSGKKDAVGGLLKQRQAEAKEAY